MSEQNCTNPVLQSSLNKASKDKFIMVLNLPYVLRKQSKTDEMLDIDFLQMNVFGTMVPEILIPSVEVRYAGQSINVSSHTRPNYPPLPVNFVIDNDYRNYYILWKWLEVLNTPTESLYGGTPSKVMSSREYIDAGAEAEYQTTVSIIGLNEYNQRAIEFVYKHCFITNLGAINYSYKEGEFIETSAQFQFNQLDIIKPKK